MSEKPKIWMSSPHMGGGEQEFVNSAFETNWVAPLGPNVNGFEQDLQDYSGMAHAAALSSGTASIHLALIILGISRGDEVLVSSFTFSGSINPILYQGAVPIMIDSEKDTWNMDPTLLEDAILDRISKTGKAPKALILVHLYGMPAKIEEIMAISRKYEVPVIEDAAEALGSEYKNQKLGSFGDLGVYSFNGNKIITTSGGGALISNNKTWVEKSRFLATQARDNAPHYEHSQVGYNYRMSNIVAGIGRGQMLVLDEWVARRRDMNHWYTDLIGNIEGLEFLTEPDERFFSNFWLTTIRIDPEVCQIDRETLRLALLDENIESRPLWKPMHMQPIFRAHPSYESGVSQNLFETGLCLPSGSNITDDERSRIQNVLENAFS